MNTCSFAKFESPTNQASFLGLRWRREFCTTPVIPRIMCLISGVWSCSKSISNGALKLELINYVLQTDLHISGAQTLLRLLELPKPRALFCHDICGVRLSLKADKSCISALLAVPCMAELDAARQGRRPA
jgi:hypothetical protein